MEITLWKTTLAYDGSEFHGWQIQPERRTIQGALADAIARVTGERILPQGAGRTDAGVHAVGQVASFSLRTPIPPDNLQRALNRILPQAIRVLSAEHAPSGFHARHSALGKIYRYRVFTGAVCSPFLCRYVGRSKWPLNLEAMQEAAKVIVGEHDFTSFAAHDPDRAALVTRRSQPDSIGSNVRRIEISQWSHETPGSADVHGLVESQSAIELDSICTYRVRGNGFLHHMVRNLVGTFLEVGRGNLAPTDVAEVLAARDRRLAGPTAAAAGLCLMQVLYGTPCFDLKQACSVGQ